MTDLEVDIKKYWNISKCFRGRLDAAITYEFALSAIQRITIKHDIEYRRLQKLSFGLRQLIVNAGHTHVNHRS